MKCEICYQKEIDEALNYCLNKLPVNIKLKLLDFIKSNPFKAINEIRLHKCSYICLIADSLNIKTDIYISEGDINETYQSLCDMSLYAHINTIKQGYISLGNGIRAGICGKAVIENNEIIGISDVSSINIRIPQYIENASFFLYKLLKDKEFNCSIILYSPPGVGKTTILRDFVNKLSKSTIRYAVIDTKNEITHFSNNTENGDFYISYPKGIAIELATKNMTPQLIICDEISSKLEADEVLCSVNAGVNLVATTHASSFNELISKAIFKDLFSNNVFQYAIGIQREYGEKRYHFTLNELK